MRFTTNLVLLTVVAMFLNLVAGVSPAEAAKGKKKKGHHAVHGVVTSVDTSKNTFTVKVAAKHSKKKGTTKPAEEKTFSETASTTYEFVHKKEVKPATATDVTVGSHVKVTAAGTTAEKVDIAKHASKKAKKAKKK